MTDVAMIRADASASVGFGHVMRCLTLADRLASVSINSIFFSRALPQSLVSRLRSAGHLYVSLETSDEIEAEIADIEKVLESMSIKPTVLVCDHYHRGRAWEVRFRNWVDRIVVIDDLANRQHECDLLVDPSFNRSPDIYRELVPASAQVLAGASYAMLRPEFRSLRQSMDPVSGWRRDRPKRVVISLGGCDQQNATQFVLDALAGMDVSILGELEIKVVVGGGYPHLEMLRKRSFILPCDVEIHVDATEMASILRGADLVFGAAGGSSWERCCLGLPTIMFVLADNQKFIAQQLHEYGAAINLGDWSRLTLRDVRDAFVQLWNNPDRLAELRRSASAICDGDGACRVVEAMLDTRTKSGQRVTIRSMQPGDDKALFYLQCVPGVRAFARNPAPPTWEQHQAWFQQRLADGSQAFYMVEVAGEPSGMVRLDRREAQPHDYEVSILIDPACHGQGLGSSALRLLRLRHSNLSLHANVHPQNKASHRIFEKAGYKRRSPDWYYLPAHQLGGCDKE